MKSAFSHAFTEGRRRLLGVEWNTNALWSSLGWVLIVVGLLGSLIPVLPGPILILAGAFVIAAGDGFERIGWPILGVLVLFTALSWGAELVITTIFTRRAGATWRTVVGAIVGGLAGGVVLSAIFSVFGALFGAAIGAVSGVLFVERGLNRRKWPDAWRVSRSYLAGCLLGRVAELSLSGLMVAIVVYTNSIMA